ncbi:SUMO-activating enzyme subunit 2 [Lamellibrachia satsuma]|nr:SUMO-activating enzyme subunit 2 [Lamellibrachia satsuma]
MNSGDGGTLVWDKDDEPALNFVTSAANLRAQIFHIPLKSKFDVKSMAGNIIPAIATTNAIIAGLLVMEGLKILSGNIDKCKTVYLNRQPNPRKKLLVPCVLDKPNPKCYVCSEKPEVTVQLNTNTVTVHTLEEKIIKGSLGMVAPDVEIDDGKGTIMISSEEGETEGNAGKTLGEFGIKNGSRLKCDDFLQVYNLNINILHVEKLKEDREFEVIGDISELQAQAASSNDTGPDAKGQEDDNDDDDLIMEEPNVITTPPSRKRKANGASDADVSAKKPKHSGDTTCQDDDIVIL